jgi:cell division transport system permease protein
MPNSFEKYQKRRLKLSSLSVIFSISLILFLLGFLGLVIIQSSNIAKNFKENFEITIFLKDRINQEQTTVFKTELENKEYTKKVTYTSKENAYKSYVEEVGEDFMEDLNINPLKNSLGLFLKVEHFNAIKIENISKKIYEDKRVFDVSYSKATVNSLNSFVKKASIWLLAISGILLLIAFVLINSYLRLSVYSKRFTIKTMQMVGATKRFIRKPFLFRSIKLGMYGAITAILFLILVLLYINTQYPDFNILNDVSLLSILFISLFIIGIFIAYISTYFATKRFLNLKTDELYY